jgi:hypothetical protein
MRKQIDGTPLCVMAFPTSGGVRFATGYEPGCSPIFQWEVGDRAHRSTEDKCFQVHRTTDMVVHVETFYSGPLGWRRVGVWESKGKSMPSGIHVHHPHAMGPHGRMVPSYQLPVTCVGDSLSSTPRPSSASYKVVKGGKSWLCV